VAGLGLAAQLLFPRQSARALLEVSLWTTNLVRHQVNATDDAIHYLDGGQGEIASNQLANHYVWALAHAEKGIWPHWHPDGE